MIEVQLNGYLHDDYEAIKELKEMGFSDEFIQEHYDRTLKIREQQNNG